MMHNYSSIAVHTWSARLFCDAEVSYLSQQFGTCNLACEMASPETMKRQTPASKSNNIQLPFKLFPKST